MDATTALHTSSVKPRVKSGITKTKRQGKRDRVTDSTKENGDRKRKEHTEGKKTGKLADKKER